MLIAPSSLLRLRVARSSLAPRLRRAAFGPRAVADGASPPPPAASAEPREGGAPSPPPAPAPPRPGVTGVRIVKVESVSDASWEGVAARERAGAPRPGDVPTRVALLAAGDAAALLLFAAVGRSSHGAADGGAAALFATASPFLLAWAAASPFLGAYSAAARDARGAAAGVRGAALSWAAAAPLGLALRSLLYHGGAPPPGPFVAVTLVSTAVLLLGWRAVAATALEPKVAAPQGGAGGGDRAGGPLEMLRVLASLTRRW